MGTLPTSEFPPDGDVGDDGDGDDGDDGDSYDGDDDDDVDGGDDDDGDVILSLTQGDHLPESG